MTFRAKIRAILTTGPRNADQVAERCDCTPKQAAQNLSALKTEGKVKAIGTIDGRISYGLDDWPEKKTAGDKAAPPPRTKRGKRRGKKARPARAVALRPQAPAPNGASVFAINDVGQLAVKKGDAGVILEPAEFARLRTFIERTAPIYDPDD